MSLSRVITGDGAASLSSAIEQYTSPDGIILTAATDIGVNPYKKKNEDRVALHIDHNMAAVIDGIGGAEQGDEFADCLAHGLATFPDDMQGALEYTKREAIRRLCWAFAGACFASVRIEIDGEEPTVTGYRRGDVRATLLSPCYDVVAESVDESLVQSLLNANVITKEQARLHPHRNVVTESIGDSDGNGRGNYKAPEPFWSKHPVERGSRILLMSDGITDNLETGEIVKLIRGAAATEAIRIIDEVTTRRMTNKKSIVDSSPDREEKGIFSDGFVLRPKLDNRGIAIIEIPS